MSTNDDLEALIYSLPCPYCKADPNEPCVTKGDNFVPILPHQMRGWIVRNAYGIGYNEGFAERLGGDDE